MGRNSKVKYELSHKFGGSRGKQLVYNIHELHKYTEIEKDASETFFPCVTHNTRISSWGERQKLNDKWTMTRIRDACLLTVKKLLWGNLSLSSSKIFI